MIILYGTGPKFGLPHASPFAIKAEVLLKMARVEYTNAMADLRKSPKGKMPWISDDEVVVADSAFIRKYLEERHGADFSAGYGAYDLGIGLAVERLMEDNVYWLNTCIRWLNRENFNKGPVQFFDAVPAIIRPIIIRMVLRKVRNNVHAQGLGRHTDEDRLYLAKLAIDAVADILGSNRFLLGDKVCGSDATLYGQLASLESRFFISPAGDHVRTKPNLMAYLNRMQTTFFADLQA